MNLPLFPLPTNHSLLKATPILPRPSRVIHFVPQNPLGINPVNRPILTINGPPLPAFYYSPLSHLSKAHAWRTIEFL
jgi:hypothetical protein